MMSHRKHLSQSLGKVPKTQVHNYKTNSVNLESTLKSVPESFKSPLLIRAPSAHIGRTEAEQVQSSSPICSISEGVHEEESSDVILFESKNSMPGSMWTEDRKLKTKD